MENRFKKGKKSNYKRGLILVVLLFVILYLWWNAEGIISNLFQLKE